MKSSPLSLSVLASMVTLAGCLQRRFPHAISSSSSSHTARDTPVEIPLEVFQIQAPVRDNYNGAVCSQTIVQNDFIASYGSPYVGIYNPPTNCTFTTVVFNMTVTSKGINYDRLSLLYLGDIEVWRSTTAMPVRTGIYYQYSKDMTAYTPLLREQQKVIMQLDNIYDSVFTGNFNVTITALFYNDEAGDGAIIHPPDAVLPISTLSSADNKTSVFSLPDGNATASLTFPRNVERAVVSVFASGNGKEEFWYTDVPAGVTSTFHNNSFAHGYGPWREVQVLIDGTLAGFVSPFPVVFTGGISPGLWVPIVGIDTYDLGSVDVDVSPWLGRLCDGEAHDFELKVVGLKSESEFGTVASNWYVSAEVFLWLDKEGNQTTASEVVSLHADEEPSALIYYEWETFSNGTNSSLYVGVSIDRSMSWSANITTSKGTSNVTWTQSVSYENHQNFTAAGNNETLWQTTTGSALSQVVELSSSSSPPAAANNGSGTDVDDTTDTAALQFECPLSFFQAYAIPPDKAAATTENSTLYAVLDRSKHETGRTVLTHLVYPRHHPHWGDPRSSSGSNTTTTTVAAPFLSTRQNGSCFYVWNNTYYQDAGAIDPADGTRGATAQWFTWAGDVLSDDDDDGAQGRVVQDYYSRFASAVDGYEPVLTADQTSDQLVAVPRAGVVAGPGINVLPGLSEAD